MTTLHDLLEAHVGAGTLPGAVGLVARGDEVEVAAVGAQDVGDGAPMAGDSVFRVASITKSVTAAALLILVEEGRVALDDPVGRWLPELGKPVVVRTPASPVDDVVPADRPITVIRRAGLPGRVRIPLRLHTAGGAGVVHGAGRQPQRPCGAGLAEALLGLFAQDQRAVQGLGEPAILSGGDDAAGDHPQGRAVRVMAVGGCP